jgi:hypothetical protein
MPIDDAFVAAADVAAADAADVDADYVVGDGLRVLDVAAAVVDVAVDVAAAAETTFFD